MGYCGRRTRSFVTDFSASSTAPRTTSQLALSMMKKRPIVTATAGKIAVAYIQRQVDNDGSMLSTRQPTAVPPSAPSA